MVGSSLSIKAVLDKLVSMLAASTSDPVPELDIHVILEQTLEFLLGVFSGF